MILFRFPGLFDQSINRIPTFIVVILGSEMLTIEAIAPRNGADFLMRLGFLKEGCCESDHT
jgi:hypothetical protein